jgi:hypothetical protein
MRQSPTGSRILSKDSDIAFMHEAFLCSEKRSSQIALGDALPGSALGAERGLALALIYALYAVQGHLSGATRFHATIFTTFDSTSQAWLITSAT